MADRLGTVQDQQRGTTGRCVPVASTADRWLSAALWPVPPRSRSAWGSRAVATQGGECAESGCFVVRQGLGCDGSLQFLEQVEFCLRGGRTTILLLLASPEPGSPEDVFEDLRGLAVLHLADERPTIAGAAVRGESQFLPAHFDEVTAHGCYLLLGPLVLGVPVIAEGNDKVAGLVEPEGAAVRLLAFVRKAVNDLLHVKFLHHVLLPISI